MKRFNIKFLKCCCIIVFLFTSEISIGQIKYGPSINIGLSNIHGGNLKDYMHTRKNESNISSSSIKFNPKLMFGIGGFFQYQLTPKAYVFSELSINYFRANISQTVIGESKGSVYGVRERVSSEANIRSLLIQVPFIFKYTIWEKKKVSLLSGFALSITGKPTMSSHDYYVRNIYSEVIDSTYIMESTSKFKLNKFNTLHFAGIIGVEKRLKRNLKKMTIGATFIYEITKSQFYSTSSSLCEANSNNLVFQECGKDNVENAGSNVNLNNFRILSFNISIKYNITKNLTSSKSE